MEFAIEQLTRRDVPVLLELIRELARFEHLEQEVEATVESLTDSLLGPQAVAGALLARSGEEVVGYAIYFFTFSSFVGRRGLWLDDLYVRPAFRRRGLGQALLERAAAIAARHRCGRFEWIALRWNQNALRFYEKLGARQLEQWSLLRMEGQGVDALLQRKGVATL